MGNIVCEIAKSSFFEHDLGHIFGNFWFHWCCRIFVFWTFYSEKLNHVLITILKNSLVQTTKLKKTLEKTRLEVDNDSQTTYPSLREKYPNMKFFLVRIFPHSNWIRRDTKYLPIQSECEKIRTRKNSVFEHFSRSPYELYLLENAKVLWGFSLPDVMTYWKTWLVIKQHRKPEEFFHSTNSVVSTRKHQNLRFYCVSKYISTSYVLVLLTSKQISLETIEVLHLWKPGVST